MTDLAEQSIRELSAEIEQLRVELRHMTEKRDLELKFKDIALAELDASEKELAEKRVMNEELAQNLAAVSRENATLAADNERFARELLEAQTGLSEVREKLTSVIGSMMRQFGGSKFGRADYVATITLAEAEEWVSALRALLAPKEPTDE